MESISDKLALFAEPTIILILNLVIISCIVWYSLYPESRSMIYITPSPFFRLLAIIMLVGISLMLSFQAAKEADIMAGFKSKGITVKGEVVKVTKKRQPIVRFAPLEGKPVKFVPSSANAAGNYAKNQKIDILYIPGTDHYLVKEGYSLYLWCKLLSVAGAASAFAMTLVMLLLSIKWEKQLMMQKYR